LSTHLLKGASWAFAGRAKSVKKLGPSPEMNGGAWEPGEVAALFFQGKGGNRGLESSMVDRNAEVWSHLLLAVKGKKLQRFNCLQLSGRQEVSKRIGALRGGLTSQGKLGGPNLGRTHGWDRSWGTG